MENMGWIGMAIVNGEITEAYDQVESILNRISVNTRPELHEKLTTAKDALFAARVLTEGSR